MIKTRHPGEYTCTICDVTNYPGTALLPTQTWWRAIVRPKVCWDCVRAGISNSNGPQEAVYLAAQALREAELEHLSSAKIRDLFERHGIATQFATLGRFAAMVRRWLSY
jgi:hypothetical protein